jgi:hypothetical protein
VIRPTGIDAYIAQQPDEVQTRLETVRALIRKAAPGAVECISYGMPAYKIDGAIIPQTPHRTPRELSRGSKGSKNRAGHHPIPSVLSEWPQQGAL